LLRAAAAAVVALQIVAVQEAEALEDIELALVFQLLLALLTQFKLVVEEQEDHQQLDKTELTAISP
jgi:hypothetical protein